MADIQRTTNQGVLSGLASGANIASIISDIRARRERTKLDREKFVANQKLQQPTLDLLELQTRGEKVKTEAAQLKLDKAKKDNQIETYSNAFLLADDDETRVAMLEKMGALQGVKYSGANVTKIHSLAKSATKAKDAATRGVFLNEMMQYITPASSIAAARKATGAEQKLDLATRGAQAEAEIARKTSSLAEADELRSALALKATEEVFKTTEALRKRAELTKMEKQIEDMPDLDATTKAGLNIALKADPSLVAKYLLLTPEERTQNRKDFVAERKDKKLANLLDFKQKRLDRIQMMLEQRNKLGTNYVVIRGGVQFDRLTKQATELQKDIDKLLLAYGEGTVPESKVPEEEVLPTGERVPLASIKQEGEPKSSELPAGEVIPVGEPVPVEGQPTLEEYKKVNRESNPSVILSDKELEDAYLALFDSGVPETGDAEATLTYDEFKAAILADKGVNAPSEAQLKAAYDALYGESISSFAITPIKGIPSKSDLLQSLIGK